MNRHQPDDVLHKCDFFFVSNIVCGEALRLENLHPNDEL